MNDHEPTRPRSVEGRLARLIESTNDICAGDEHRREPLVERGEAHGLDRATAEQAYDIAVEEKLPPAYGIAVTAAGISVQSMETPPPDVRAAEAGEPDWVDRPPATGDADAERRMRQTFRRVRSVLAAAPTPRDAFEALAGESDLEIFDY